MIFDPLPYGCIPIVYDINYYYDWKTNSFVESNKKIQAVPLEEFIQPEVEVEDIIIDIYNESKTYSDYELHCIYDIENFFIQENKKLNYFSKTRMGFYLLKEEEVIPFKIPFYFRKGYLDEQKKKIEKMFPVKKSWWRRIFS